MRPPASLNVVVPLLSLVAVPVVRPEPSRNVLVPLLSVLTVPVIRPLASRIVVYCADAAVANASRMAANRAVSFIGSRPPRAIGGIYIIAIPFRRRYTTHHAWLRMRCCIGIFRLAPKS